MIAKWFCMLWAPMIHFFFETLCTAGFPIAETLKSAQKIHKTSKKNFIEYQGYPPWRIFHDAIENNFLSKCWEFLWFSRLKRIGEFDFDIDFAWNVKDKKSIYQFCHKQVVRHQGVRTQISSDRMITQTWKWCQSASLGLGYNILSGNQK